MSCLSRRALRRTALLLVFTATAAGLTSCKKDDLIQRSVLDAIQSTIASPRTFVFVDQDLTHRTTVSGQVADSLRYRLLLNVDGRPIWQQIVKDDAVANLFVDRSQVATYTGAGSSPAVDVVSDYALMRAFLPRGVPAPPLGGLPHTQTLSPSLALLSLQAGLWVIDPRGAPILPTVGTSGDKIATTPFLRPLLMLAAVYDEVHAIDPDSIKKWSPDDLSPTFKLADDPFPKPEAGVSRYDVKEAPLPQITATSKGSRPDPPGDDALRKLAIYLKDGKVVAIRENFDILDRLQDMARLYQIPLQLNTATGTVNEQRIGQLMVELIQAGRPVPYRVHEEQLLVSYPPTAPTIDLPKPAVTADLAGVLPGQGHTSSTPVVTAGG